MKCTNTHEDMHNTSRSLKGRITSFLCERLANSAVDPRGCMLGLLYEPELHPELLEEMFAE